MKTRKFLFLIFIILGVGIESCSIFDMDSSSEMASSDDKAISICGVSDPINELHWLNEQYQAIKDIPDSGIVLYRYEGKDVIEIQSPVMSSTNLSQYYCDGTKLQFDTPETYEKDYKDFRSNSVKVKVLYGIDLWKL